jgi:hydrogenase expression/formation protein HypC
MCLGIPMRVVDVSGEEVVLEQGGMRIRARTDLIEDPISVGDYLLVHAGFAIQKVDEGEALETLAMLEEMLGTL